MKSWLMTAFLLMMSGHPVLAAAPQADPGEGVVQVKISGDTINPEVMKAFFDVLKAARQEPSETLGVPGRQEAEPAESEGGCVADEQPFAELFETIPVARFDAIAQSHGFADAAHWQRIGNKLIALSAIEAMVKETKLSEDDLKLRVGDAFGAE
jgi:hypothetical protein